MRHLDLSPSERLPIVMDLVSSLSKAQTPEEVLKIFAEGRNRLDERPHPYVSLSTRNLPEGSYKITRSLTLDDITRLDSIVQVNPWRDWQSIPTHHGGVLGEIVRSGRPVVLHDMDLSSDPALGERFADCRSLMALPLFDGGKPLNWAVSLSPLPDDFSLDDVEQRLLTANLVGGTVRHVQTARRLNEASTQIAHELRRIAEIQRALVPTDLPKVPGMSVAASYRTFDQAGGDLFAISPVANGTPGTAGEESTLWTFMVADASGHGPSAAVVMAMLHAILNAVQGAEGGPSRCLRRANRQLCDKRIEQSFVTAFLAGYDTRSRRMVYGRAGHNPPLLMSPVKGGWEVERIDAVGDLPLGIIPDVDYQTAETTLQPGQTLLMYTDGITEAMSPGRELFGEKRLIETLIGTDGSPQAVLHAVHQAVEKHQDGARAGDDQTMLAIRVEAD